MKAWVWRGFNNISIEERDTCDFTVTLFGKEKLGIVREHGSGDIWKPPSTSRDYFVPLLKSNLQKAIRRQLHITCLRTTLQLLIQTPLELLRRLPIIALEDVNVIECIDGIVWLMVWLATGNKLYVEDVEFILNYVWDLSHHSTFYRPSKLVEPLEDLMALKIKWWNSESITSISLSLLVRMFYNGTDWDMRLLASFHNNHSIVPRVPRDDYPNYRDIGELEETDRLVVAADFHCSNMIAYFGSKWNLSTRGKCRLRELVWNHISSMNTRIPKRDKLPCVPMVGYTWNDFYTLYEKHAGVEWSKSIPKKRRNVCCSIRKYLVKKKIVK